MDFSHEWWRSDITTLDNLTTYGVSLPGASNTFCLERDAKVVYLSWNVGILDTGRGGTEGASGVAPDWYLPRKTSTAERMATLGLFVDGHLVSRYQQQIVGGRRCTYDREKVKYQHNNCPAYPDARWWAGSAALFAGHDHDATLPVGVLRPWAAGFHTYEIRLVSACGYTPSGTGFSSWARSRVRARSMSYRYRM
jgi:hypothetical protein